MKGLDWFRVMSDIAFDDDLENVSDAAFRTFIELLGISAYRLSDGRVAQRDAQKLCNTRYLARSLAELSASRHIILDGDEVVVREYAKYQQTREEVEAEREKSRDRVRRYRAVTTENVREQSKSKSKSKSKSTPPTPPKKSPIEAQVLELLYSIPGFPVDEKRELDVLREPRDPRVDLVAEARGFSDWVADQRDKGKKTFNFRSSWRNRLNLAEKWCKERNGPLPPAHVPFDESRFDVSDAVPPPPEMRELMASIGKEMP